MNLKKLYITLLLVFAIGCSGKKETSSEDSTSNSSVTRKDFCPLLVAKLGQCTKESGVRHRFNFQHLKKWIYEDCEKARKANSERYSRLYQCSEKDCNGLNACLENLLKTEK
ncbi:MAG: hypothetical protein JXR95_01790 [Deltaproteobacteria bacterium]|nr:hypothetical protein [Deltaproteobacteria bacterium]